MTGKKKTTIDESGKKTVTYEKAPIEDWAAAIAIIVPGLGIAAAAAARLASRGARATAAGMDTNEEAIEKMDWTKVNTKESFKIALNAAQGGHKDAKLIHKEFKKWKSKKDKAVF